jgi:hypothetical protein
MEQENSNLSPHTARIIRDLARNQAFLQPSFVEAPDGTPVLIGQ